MRSRSSVGRERYVAMTRSGQAHRRRPGSWIDYLRTLRCTHVHQGRFFSALASPAGRTRPWAFTIAVPSEMVSSLAGVGGVGIRQTPLLKPGNALPASSGDSGPLFRRFWQVIEGSEPTLVSGVGEGNDTAEVGSALRFRTPRVSRLTPARHEDATIWILIHSAGPPALARVGSSCFTSTVTPGRRSANVPFTFVCRILLRSSQILVRSVTFALDVPAGPAIVTV